MKYSRKIIVILLFAASLFSFQIYYTIPGRVLLQEGERYNFPPMVSTVTKSDKTQLKLFGVLPFKTVRVSVVEKTHLIPCGNAIGIKISVNGVMVVGMSDVRASGGKKHMPAKAAGIKQGDIIKKAGGLNITDIVSLTEAIQSSEGRPVEFEIIRNDETVSLNVTPVMSKDDSKYRIGAWVRDSSSGIGTITFVNPKNNSFAALGHGITDTDTGKIIPAGSGDILRSSIVGVKKGERGSPGELRGVFSSVGRIGEVLENTSCGVFGKFYGAFDGDGAMPIGTRSQVRLGDAYILSNIESDKVERYSVSIERVMKNAINNKGMILKITDTRLLNKTGGIVQGMSGSPIIQDGKLIGAVTHVFINDPTRGYGTFIELMLNNTIIDSNF